MILAQLSQRRALRGSETTNIAQEAVEESPFSTVAVQSDSQQLSNSDYSTESPKSGSKKRKKKKKASGGQQAVSNGREADQRGGEAASSGESDAERLDAEEEGSDEPEAKGRADGIQVSTEAPAGSLSPLRRLSGARRQPWVQCSFRCQHPDKGFTLPVRDVLIALRGRRCAQAV